MALIHNLKLSFETRKSSNRSELRADARLAPIEILCDFEKTIHQTLSYHFNVRIRGCHFHYTQAIWRKINELGKQNFIN
jgi:hypothetical protein